MGKLNYREDKHLEFLANLDNESLEVLVRLLTEDKKGNKRLTEELTEQEEYKKFYPDHKKYWNLIAAEYQYFGGNTIVNIWRKQGVLYEEILQDTCKDMKVNLPKEASVDRMEKNLLMKTIEDSIENMSVEDRKKLLDELDIKTENYSKEAVIFLLQGGIRMGGFLAYQMAVVVANAVAKAVVGNGLAFAANAALMRYMAIFAGPIGWFVTGLWTAVDLAGPAKRVAIPATIYIAALRQAELNKQAFELKCPSCGSPIADGNAKFCSNCGAQL